MKKKIKKYRTLIEKGEAGLLESPAEFKKDFIEQLKNKLPEKIRDLNLIYEDKYYGWIRFDNLELTAVYLIDVGLKNPEPNRFPKDIILKFKYRDFHYVTPDFIFDSIYMCPDGINESRYDSELNLESKYLVAQNDILDDEDIIINSSYKVEELGQKVKIPYTFGANRFPPIPNYFKCDMVEKITNNFDIHKCIWGSKQAEEGYNKDKVSIYLGVL